MGGDDGVAQLAAAELRVIVGGMDTAKTVKRGGKTVKTTQRHKQLHVPSSCFYFELAVGVRTVNHDVFCVVCRRPVSGVRFTCAHCVKLELCSSCEASVSAGTTVLPKHSPSTHCLLVFRRTSTFKVNNVSTNRTVGRFYTSRDPVPTPQQQIHDATCCLCLAAPFKGDRYHCGHCGVDVCGSCFHDRSTEHFIDHVFVKLPRPLPPTVQLPSGKLLPDTVSQKPSATARGYAFLVTPKFSLQYQAELLHRQRNDLVYAVNTQSSWTLNADHQLCAFVSLLCDKKTATADVATRAMTRAGRSQRRVSETPVVSPLKMSPSDIKPSVELARFPELEHRKLVDLRMRFAVLRLLNIRLTQLLPLINWDNKNNDQSVAYTFRRVRGVVFSQLKMGMWNRAIQCSANDSNRQFRVVLDRQRALEAVDGSREDEGSDVGVASVEVSDDALFMQLANQLLKQPASALRMNSQPFSVRFTNEAGVDVGGVFRDALSEIMAELQSDRLPLLLPCPNAVNKVGHTLDRWVPNSACASQRHLKLFDVLGRCMGMAARLQEPLQLNLPPLCWKVLVDMDVDVKDLDAVDLVLVRTMRMLQDPAELAKNDITPQNFHELEFTWSVTTAAGHVVALRPSGAQQVVAWEDKEAYATAALNARLHEFTRQMEAVAAGLASVIPRRLLPLLTPLELESLVCGDPQLDVELLKKHTRYNGLSASDPPVRFFWNVLTKFSQVERSMFLRFAWGRSRLPIASNFTDTMTISAFPVPNGGLGEDSYLPKSHTCFFSVELPQYSSEDVCCAKLLTAITMCNSVDLA